MSEPIELEPIILGVGPLAAQEPIRDYLVFVGTCRLDVEGTAHRYGTLVTSRTLGYVLADLLAAGLLVRIESLPVRTYD